MPNALQATEFAATAAAAQAQAMVQAAYTMAIGRPRDIAMVRQNLLSDCKRPEFAREAVYAKPIGNDTIQGLSIRFAECARRSMTNMDNSRLTLYEDAERKIVRVVVLDLESNTRESRDVTVTKVQERRYLRRGQEALSQRTNSTGQTVYTVRPSDDELTVKENALCAKAERECTLKLLPADLKAEALEMCKAVAERDIRSDGVSEQRKRIADAFGELGISPADITEYLGHDLGKTTPAAIASLRQLHTALRDGETTWADVLATKREGDADAEAEVKAQQQQKTQPGNKSGRVAETLKNRRKPAAPPEPPPVEESRGSNMAPRERFPEPGSDG